MSEGPWIQTFTGQAWDLDDPKPQNIVLVDVAKALSQLCRFNGHTRRHYSVAEHSVRVARLVRGVAPERVDQHLAALLHDAHEAYLGDVATPLKQLMPSQTLIWWKELQRRTDLAILKWAGLPELLVCQCFPFSCDVIETADRRMLAWEARDLMAPHPKPWIELPEPPRPRLVPWSDCGAEETFIETFFELHEAWEKMRDVVAS